MIYTDETTIDDVLAAWDAGDTIWSVEMGGLGPGYEQALQLFAVELLRSPEFRACCPPGGGEWVGGIEAMRSARNAVYQAKCRDLGLSGAQAGAATNIASMLICMGPRKAIDAAPMDRQIQVSKRWPQVQS